MEYLHSPKHVHWLIVGRRKTGLFNIGGDTSETYMRNIKLGGFSWQSNLEFILNQTNKRSENISTKKSHSTFKCSPHTSMSLCVDPWQTSIIPYLFSFLLNFHQQLVSLGSTLTLQYHLEDNISTYTTYITIKASWTTRINLNNRKRDREGDVCLHAYSSYQQHR